MDHRSPGSSLRRWWKNAAKTRSSALCSEWMSMYLKEWANGYQQPPDCRSVCMWISAGAPLRYISNHTNELQSSFRPLTPPLRLPDKCTFPSSTPIFLIYLHPLSAWLLWIFYSFDLSFCTSTAQFLLPSHTLSHMFHFTGRNRLFFLLLRDAFLLPTCFCPSGGPTLCWTEAQWERNECSLDIKKGPHFDPDFFLESVHFKTRFLINWGEEEKDACCWMSPHLLRTVVKSRLTAVNHESSPANHRDIKTP